VPQLEDAGERQQRQEPDGQPRTMSALTMMRRRSKRSLSTPPSSSRAMVGIVIVIPTSARAVGALDSA
jgi:hypothetical protein